MNEPTIKWKGKSGHEYTFWIYPLNPFPNLKAIGGNYMFAKETKPNIFAPLYKGETNDLSERFNGHHKWDDCIRNGATHIHVHINEDRKARLFEEADIIAMWNPPLNG